VYELQKSLNVYRKHRHLKRTCPFFGLSSFFRGTFSSSSLSPDDDDGEDDGSGGDDSSDEKPLKRSETLVELGSERLTIGSWLVVVEQTDDSAGTVLLVDPLLVTGTSFPANPFWPDDWIGISDFG
jgi:hypothetical protein